MASQGIVNQRSSIDRKTQLLAEGTQMPDMVQMVMSDKNSFHAGKVELILRHDFLKPPQAHTRIYEQCTFLISKEIAIAATPARETHEPKLTTFHPHSIFL